MHKNVRKVGTLSKNGTVQLKMGALIIVKCEMCSKYTQGMAAIEEMTEYKCEETTREGKNQENNNEEAASDKPEPKTVDEEFRTMINRKSKN